MVRSVRLPRRPPLETMCPAALPIQPGAEDTLRPRGLCSRLSSLGRLVCSSSSDIFPVQAAAKRLPCVKDIKAFDRNFRQPRAMSVVPKQQARLLGQTD